MGLDLSRRERVLVDDEVVETGDGTLDTIVAGSLFVTGGGECFGEDLRLEADLVEPVRQGELASPGEVLRRFLEITGLLPRLRELEAGTGEFVGKSWLSLKHVRWPR